MSPEGPTVTAPDLDLIRALHDEHGAALWSYVLALTRGDRAAADDVVQETMVRAWRHPQVLDPSRGSPRAWLFTVARRILIDERRSKRARSEVSMAALPDVAAPDDDHVVQTHLVAQALTQLSAAHREVIGLCFFQGFSVGEAATRLGIAEGTVKSRSHYALRALRRALVEMGVTG